MAVIIREARPEDYETLCALFEQMDALDREHLPHIFQEPDGPARDKGYILQLIFDKDTGLFVAEEENQVIGMIHILLATAQDLPIYVPRCYAILCHVAVVEENQRQGVGSLLMQTSEQWAREHGADSIELGVREFNTGARTFYRQSGL
jgi:GNAT superfamily N-acetyltransferase